MKRCPSVRSENCLREHYEHRLESAWENIRGWQELYDKAQTECRNGLSYLSIAAQMLGHCNDAGILNEVGQAQLNSIQRFIDGAEAREPSTAKLTAQAEANHAK